MASIAVVGSINMDIVVRAERFPRPGETWRGGDVRFLAGGKGANQTVAAARLGGRVAFVVAAFALEVSRGADPFAAARFANAAGALAATRLGAQPSLPRRDEVERFLREK